MGSLIRRRLTRQGLPAGIRRWPLRLRSDGTDMGNNANKAQITDSPPVFISITGLLRQMK
ncbi:hypothetical protein [Candidatus Sodalis sp. SoCistrobi]|uniref:hypothetical protein n=1 Tax=Candidatus Sodalis sp. SoCistrobi TaxID=1922216 RepID=UPI00093F31E3|nr:hypothetical protein [Candidatus Sodalis sp. SoCistrobi]